MNSWIISVASIVVITSILTLILPEGKTAVLIKSVFSILVVCVLIKPIFNFGSEESFSSEVFYDNIEIQQDYLYYANQKKIEGYKEYCSYLLKEKGIESKNVDIYYENQEDFTIIVKKIYLNVDKSVISLDNQHKYILDEICSKISAHVKVDKENIVVYE